MKKIAILIFTLCFVSCEKDEPADETHNKVVEISHEETDEWGN